MEKKKEREGCNWGLLSNIVKLTAGGAEEGSNLPITNLTLGSNIGDGMPTPSIIPCRILYHLSC